MVRNIDALGPNVESPVMDDVDRAILRQLQENGRLSNLELAERVLLSPSACLRRVRHLESSGVIVGYRAVIAPVAIGRAFDVLLHVEMARQDRATIEAFEGAMQALDQVIECRRMFGSPDYLIWIAVADLDEYEQFYMDKVIGMPGLARTNSQFTMKIVKSIGRLPP